MFDYVASRCGASVLKNAMQKADNTTPQDVDINFKYQGRKVAFLCRIYRFHHQFLIGGWRRPGNLIHFPGNDTAA